MLNKIRYIAEKYNMLNEGDTVVCGLSGGADSVCLLLSLCEISHELGISVEALHVNHCLRGAESDHDEEFCRSLCSRLDIPFTAVSCDVKAYSAENALSCEEAARELRYDIFRSHTAGKKLATAHNADDNLETMLLNLVRGTGLKGISGIPPKRDNIIRPLLCVSRREIEEYLQMHGQDYVTDSTNLTDDYTRNKLRHNVIPLLKELNGSLTETSVRTSAVLRSENELIEAKVDEAMEKRLKDGVFSGISAYHEVVRRRCISRMLSEKGMPVSAKRLEECDSIAINGGKLNISGNIYLVSDGMTMKLTEILPKTNELIEKELQLGENRLFPQAKLICRLVNCENFKKNDFVNKNLTFYLLDYDKIIGRAVVRSRKFGDKLRLRGRKFTSSVKKSINETVPVSMRSSLHFIEDEEGTVFAEMIGIADRAAPDKNTSRLLVVYVEREG